MMKARWLAILTAAMLLLGAGAVARGADPKWPKPGEMKKAQAPAAPARTSVPPPPVGPRVEWSESFIQASRLARQNNKIMLVYAAGSDWCEWCKKLDREVLQTPMFVEWAKRNVIPVLIDFPSPEKNQSRALAKQNEILAASYNIAKVPTLLFLDSDGEVIDRVGYDGACLRDDEKKGSPMQAMNRFDSILKNRPTGQQIKEYTFLEAAEITEKTGQPILVMVTKPDAKMGVDARDRLLKSTKLAKFVNANMVFVNLTWPADDDYSAQAKWFRNFAEGYKVGPASFQLLVMTYGGRKLQHRIIAVDQVDALVNQLAQQLPKFDYNGTWLTDYRKAQSIAAQTQRDMLISFTSFDSSEWCQKLKSEIYDQDGFKDYAKKNLVLVQADFPTATEQPTEVKTQNQSLAEAFNIRGYPSMVLINAKGQKIGTAKYMPGGPAAFIKELDELRKRDFERRTLTSEQVEIKKKPGASQ